MSAAVTEFEDISELLSHLFVRSTGGRIVYVNSKNDKTYDSAPSTPVEDPLWEKFFEHISRSNSHSPPPPLLFRTQRFLKTPSGNSSNGHKGIKCIQAYSASRYCSVFNSVLSPMVPDRYSRHELQARLPLPDSDITSATLMTLPQLFPSWYEFRNHIVRHFDKDNTEPTPFISFSGNLQWTIHRASRLDSPNDKGTCDDCEARIFVVNNNRSIKSSESPIGRCFQMRAAMEFINSLTEPGTKRAFEKGSMDWAQNADEWLVIGHVSDENIIARSSWNRLGSYTFLQNLTKFQYCFTLGIFRKFQSESQNFNSGRDVDKKEYRRLITEMCSTGYDVAKGQVLEDEEDEWEKKVQGWLIEEIEKYGWCYFVRA